MNAALALQPIRRILDKTAIIYPHFLHGFALFQRDIEGVERKERPMTELTTIEFFTALLFAGVAVVGFLHARGQAKQNRLL